MRGSLFITPPAPLPPPTPKTPPSAGVVAPVALTDTAWTTIGTLALDVAQAPDLPAEALAGELLTLAACTPGSGGTGEIRLVGVTTGTVFATRTAIAAGAPAWSAETFSADDSTAFVQARRAPASPATTLTVWSAITSLD